MIRLRYVVWNYRIKIRNEFSEFPQIKINFRTRNFKFGCIVETIPACFTKSVPKIEVTAAQTNGIIFIAFVRRFKFIYNLAVRIKILKQTQRFTANSLRAFLGANSKISHIPYSAEFSYSKETC